MRYLAMSCGVITMVSLSAKVVSEHAATNDWIVSRTTCSRGCGSREKPVPNTGITRDPFVPRRPTKTHSFVRDSFSPLKLADATLEPNPVNLDPQLARVCAGVHRLDGPLMVVLDVDRLLDADAEAIAA